MAEGEGFEPPVLLRVHMISSHAQSTGLCHPSFAVVATLLIASEDKLLRKTRIQYLVRELSANENWTGLEQKPQQEIGLFQAEFTEEPHHRAPVAEGLLEQVKPGKGRQPEPVRVVKVRQAKAGQDEPSGCTPHYPFHAYASSALTFLRMAM